MIESIQRMICLHKSDEKGEDDAEASTPTRITTTLINPAIMKHCELQIKTLQTAPRDVGEIGANYQSKREEKGRRYINAY